jgi:adenylate cyclase
LRGLAEFSLDRYEDAAASLEETLAGPAPNRYENLLPLMAAYGKLGALDKARALRKELDAYTAAYGDGKMTALLAAHHVPFVRLEDALRFQDGLVKAGIPELPFEFEPGSKDRLSEEEIRALLYGHTVSGRVERSIDSNVRMVIDFKVGVTWSVTTSFDGASVRYIWGDVHNGGGRIHNDGRRQCFYFSYEKACIAVFRNPVGSRERQDEYYALFPWYLISFSPER